MLCRNITVKELFASIPDSDYIAYFFDLGLAIGSSQLAVSAMEELMVRSDTITVITVLQLASENGGLQLGTSITTMIARSLSEYREDPILCRYGKALLKGEGGEGIMEWIKKPETAKLFRDEQQALWETIQAEKAKDRRATLCNNSYAEWMEEAIKESFQPGS